MKFLLTILISLTAMSLSAQIQLKTFFEQDTVMIGDTVGLNYQILVLPDTEIMAVDLAILDSMFTLDQLTMVMLDSTLNWEDIFEPDVQFEIANYGRWSPSEGNTLLSGDELKWRETPGTKQGQRVLSNRLTVIFWSEGSYLVPEPNIEYKIANQPTIRSQATSARKMVVTAPIIVDVSEIDTLTQLTPIKPILEESRNWKDYFWLYVIFGLVIFGALLYRYLTKEEIVEEVEPEIILPAHVIALEKLEDLKKAELWQKGDVKEYQTRLTYTLREYLENRYEMQALESTTAQINEDLRKSDVAESWRNKLRDLLQVADLVKFAKAEPEEEFHARVLNEAVEFVEETKAEEVEHIELNTNSDENLEAAVIKSGEEKVQIGKVQFVQNAANDVNNSLLDVSTDNVFLLASRKRRFLANLITTIANLVLTLIAYFSLYFLSSINIYLAVTIFLLLILGVLYHAAILTGRGNQSLGKYLLNLSTITEEGTIPLRRTALKRYLVRIFAIFFIVGFVRALLDRNHPFPHDRISKTWVVKIKK